MVSWRGLGAQPQREEGLSEPRGSGTSSLCFSRTHILQAPSKGAGPSQPPPTSPPVATVSWGVLWESYEWGRWKGQLCTGRAFWRWCQRGRLQATSPTGAPLHQVACSPFPPLQAGFYPLGGSYSPVLQEGDARGGAGALGLPGGGGMTLARPGRSGPTFWS